ncbi:MAG: hypothetical protein DRR03_09790 [Gammaproteobacteria bacterium]|nr:MAG: hypothetical protein DRR03_09790 [Gammaproteobacteria bacterium]
MRPSITRLPVLALLSILTALPLHASDKAKEQRWAEQIVDQLIEGEAVWLQAGDDRFLSILTEAEGAPRGSVILLHGIGVHPNWPQVIYPLRVGLARLGWTTLSLQMPILPNEATDEDYLPLFSEVAPRIDAGLALLADHDLLPTVIVAHSMGANMASFYLRDARSGGSVAGFVGIGMSGRSNGGNNDIATSLGLIGLPVLDLYGDRDLKIVLDSVDRRFAAGSVNRHYEQRIARNSNHFFDDTNAELLTLVDEWLATKTLP